MSTYSLHRCNFCLSLKFMAEIQKNCLDSALKSRRNPFEKHEKWKGSLKTSDYLRKKSAKNREEEQRLVCKA